MSIFKYSNVYIDLPKSLTIPSRQRSLLLIAVHGLLIALASLVEEPQVLGTWASVVAAPTGLYGSWT